MTAPLRVLVDSLDESPEDVPADGLWAATGADLSERALDVLAAIQDLTTAQGWPPTFTELAEATNCKAKSHARYFVGHLRDAGLVRMGDGFGHAGARQLVLTNAGWSVLLAAEGCGLAAAA